MFKYVHHVHYVVQDREAMVTYIDKTFGLKPIRLDESQSHGKEAYYQIGKTQIQVSSPTDPVSGIGKFLAAHGPGVFHVAWAVDDARKVANELAAKGTKMEKRGKDGKEIAGENKDGVVVCNIDPADSLGLWFQLVGG